MEFRADLHCHSNCSDGSDAPLALLAKAKEANLSALSITDHDTVAAYTPELFQAADLLGLKLLPGVEISSEKAKTQVHILGYGVDLEAKGFLQFLEAVRAKRAERNRAILQKLREIKIDLDAKELQGETIGRPHIAALLVKKGYVSSMEEAFHKYLKDGALCATTGFRFSPEEVIEEIHKAKGKAVLAHPHCFIKSRFVTELLMLPFDGIECYYGAFSKAQEGRFLQEAKARSLLITGGSDYHGAFKPHVPLGASWIDREAFFKVCSLAQKNLMK